MKFVFCHSKLRKQPFLLKFSNSCPLQHPCLCIGKVRATPLKIGVISSVLTSFSLVKFCWTLYAKWNVWQININCVFVFSLAALNSYVYFCIDNTTGIRTDNLLIATYALSCLCILVFKYSCRMRIQLCYLCVLQQMWKSCDFECV